MEPRTYRVTVLGRLSDRFASAFDGVSIEPGEGETVLTGKLDQAQLHGILDRLRDFGLELRSVEEVTP
jgi:hypothetical protein